MIVRQMAVFLDTSKLHSRPQPINNGSYGITIKYFKVGRGYSGNADL